MVKVEGLQTVFNWLQTIDKEILQELINSSSSYLFKEAKKNIKPHIKTGRLERNLRVKPKKSELEAFISNNNMLVDFRGQKVNYALFVHFGTRAHLIKRKTKKALRPIKNSLFVFAKEIKHPGYKGDPFLYNAAQKTFENIENIYKGIKNDF